MIIDSSLVLHGSKPCCGGRVRRLHDGRNKRACVTCRRKWIVTVTWSGASATVGHEVWSARWEEVTQKIRDLSRTIPKERPL